MIDVCICYSTMAGDLIIAKTAEKSIQNFEISFSLVIRMNCMPKTSKELQMNVSLNEILPRKRNQKLQSLKCLICVLSDKRFRMTPVTFYWICFTVELRRKDNINVVIGS